MDGVWHVGRCDTRTTRMPLFAKLAICLASSGRLSPKTFWQSWPGTKSFRGSAPVAISTCKGQKSCVYLLVGSCVAWPPCRSCMFRRRRAVSSWPWRRHGSQWSCSSTRCAPTAHTHTHTHTHTHVWGGGDGWRGVSVTFMKSWSLNTIFLTSAWRFLDRTARSYGGWSSRPNISIRPYHTHKHTRTSTLGCRHIAYSSLRSMAVS